MKKVIFIVLALISINCFAQKINYSIELSYNQPFISEIKNKVPSAQYNTGYISISPNYNIKETYDSKSGFNFGGKVSYLISEKISIQAGLKVNLIRYKQATIIDNTDVDNITIGTFIESGEPYGILQGTITARDEDCNLIISGIEPFTPYEPKDSDKLGNTSILYTEIPIQFGYSFFNNKLKCKLGIITSLLTYSEVYKYNTEFLDFNNTILKDKSGDGFSNVVWNGSFELEYMVLNKVGLTLNYSRSFNSIYDDDISIGSPKYNIFSLGLTYNFIK